MIQDPIEQDSGLGAELRAVSADQTATDVDWAALRASINRRAAPELARRARPRRGHLVVPMMLAASIALFVLLPRMPDGTNPGAADDEFGGTTSGRITVDDILDADMSDRQLRALLFGAGDVDDLLAIAAAEGELP